MDKDLKDLRWVRLFNPTLIPKYLVEQVKNREYSVDDFFKFQELNCLVNTKGSPTLNPFNHLYALVSNDNQVKGYMWAVIDPLTKDMLINTFSIAKEYWHNGEAVSVLQENVEAIIKKMKIDKVLWITTAPKHSKKYGFKDSKNVMMEYSPDKKNKEKKDG